MNLPSLRDIHWPHLLLLATLPLAWRAGHALPPTLLLVLWLAFAAALLGLAERVAAARDDWHWRRADGPRDGGVLALNVLVDAVVALLLTMLAMQVAPTKVGLPLALEWPLALLVGEFGSYWLHRLSHRGGWLWRVHLLHHRPERLNLGNALTAHPINALYDKLARVAPLVLLGFSADAIEIATLFALTQGLVTHANVAGTIGPLNWLIGSAELHRLHHSTRAADAGNFGTALPFWDQLFGSYRHGHAPAAVGVFDPTHYPGEHDLAALLCWPLRRHAAMRTDELG